MGVKPEETLYIGKNMNEDIIPANKIGLKTALLIGDEALDCSFLKDVTLPNPTVMFTEFEQLPDYIL